MSGAHFRHKVSRLTPASQKVFDRMVAAHQAVTVARMLGIAPRTVDKMVHGGSAAPETVEKVESALKVIP